LSRRHISATMRDFVGSDGPPIGNRTTYIASRMVTWLWRHLTQNVKVMMTTMMMI